MGGRSSEVDFSLQVKFEILIHCDFHYISRPELFDNYAGMYQVVDTDQNCTTECSLTSILSQIDPFSIVE